MSSKIRAALEQMRRARQGERRTDQYEVKAEKKIIEEVTEEEYRKVVNERRESFVVDGGGAYDDRGKEIWEVAEERRYHRAEELAYFASVKSKSSKVPEPVNPAVLAAAQAASARQAAKAKDRMRRAFTAGAVNVGGESTTLSSAAPADAIQHKDIDDMLQQMCGQLEAGQSASSSSAAQKDPARAAGSTKRRSDVPAERTPPAKRAAPLQVGSPVKLEKSASRDSLEAHSGGGGTLPPPKQEPAPLSAAARRRQERAAAAEAAMAAFLTEPEEEPMQSMSSTTSTSSRAQATVIEEPQHEGASMGVQDGACTGLDDWTLQAQEECFAKATQEQSPAVEGQQWQPKAELCGGIWFYFIDAVEDERTNRVHLFGKVKASLQAGNGQFAYQSCCFVVEQMERCVYLLLNVTDPTDQEALQVAAQQAEGEFDEVCRKQFPGIVKQRAKLKFRNYAWEKSLPHSDGGLLPFLKVVYKISGAHHRLPPEGLSGKTFTHSFGGNTSLVERLLITRRIMGPSWLKILPGTFSDSLARLSSCCIELRGTAPSIASVKTEEDQQKLRESGMPTSPPPLRMMSISMQTVQRSNVQGHEPVAIACTCHPYVRPDGSEGDQELRTGLQTWVALRRLDTRPLPRDSETVLPKNHVQYYTSESALLGALLSKVQDFDPDVIVGYNAYGFDLDVIGARMAALNLQGWQKLGRLKRRSEKLKHDGKHAGGFWAGSHITAGRLVCDVLLQARDLLPKLGGYDLPRLAREQLNFNGLSEIEPEHLRSFYDSAKSLVDLCWRTFYNALCIARLAHSLQILPLSKQLTNLAGNLWSSSLQNRRADRNEMLLCHEFHRKKFVLPDKESGTARRRRQQAHASDSGFPSAFGEYDGPDDAGPDGGMEPTGSVRRGKAQYSGGLVLDPKAGLYDTFVMLLDFNSLYPSVIQEYNICFTTVERPNEQQLLNCATETQLLERTRLPDGLEEEGVLPQVLRRLVQGRRAVKDQMKKETNGKKHQMLDIKQKALKLTANSMYGTLGFQNSRFYAKPLAALITAKGREALQTTISVVQQELSLDVVYGDTDSVFVNSQTKDYDQAMQTANSLKRAVNRRYRTLEIEVDAVFDRLLLLKKKKYAGRKVLDWKGQRFEAELKGLDIVRRDWCALAKEVGHNILEKVLSGADTMEVTIEWIHTYLKTCAKQMDEGSLPVEKFVICKGLTKAPKDYPDAKHQPHVLVALRLEQRGKSVTAGQEIPYVIVNACAEDGGKMSFAERARHPRELEVDDKLKIDLSWYKAQQLHPVIVRILACVEGTDPSRLAECLGLDGSRFARKAASNAHGLAELTGGMAAAVGATWDCRSMLDRSARFKTQESVLPGVSCPSCMQAVSWEVLLGKSLPQAESAQLFMCGICGAKVRPVIAENQLVTQLRRLLREHAEGWVLAGNPGCPVRTRRGKRGPTSVTERLLFQELQYFEHLLEQATTMAQRNCERDCDVVVERMTTSVQHLLETNGRNWVDCGALFGSIFKMSKTA
eukprot:TRINITY_DN21176_c0_g1_i2.p1 TRINITY_DN21176_c0_g1~~TRINITY_DN21176_c0_g1_i2.p1  ORF type:complete len:1507 (+),score=333.68 TRINITY_DN21176_c0_g1_i2:75-4595(+)